MNEQKIISHQASPPLKHSVWFHSLITTPDVRITVGGKTSSMPVRRVPGYEKAQLWPICCEYYPPCQDDQAPTGGNIPVFLCEYSQG